MGLGSTFRSRVDGRATRSSSCPRARSISPPSTTVQAELDIAAGEAERVVLDLRAVTFIDSAGIRLVLEAMRALREFAVVPGGPEVSRVFRLVGLDERVRIVDRPPDE